jgi:hypothetical protein
MITRYDLILWASGFLAGIGVAAVVFFLLRFLRPQAFRFRATVRQLPLPLHHHTRQPRSPRGITCRLL